MIELGKIIKEIGCGKIHARDIDHSTALTLYSEILANKIPDLELGSILISLRIKGESEEEIHGFYCAMQKQVIKLQPPLNRPMPVVIPSYNGARRQGNLTPLLGFLLVKLGFPVIIHGISSDPRRVTTKQILSEMGIEPVSNIEQAQNQLNKGKLTFITINNLCEPIEKQLLLRWRMGVRNSGHILVKLATPFDEKISLRITSVSHPEYLYRVSKFYQKIKANAILLSGTEGEVYANPQRCPDISIIHDTGKILTIRAKKQHSIEISTILPKSKNVQDTTKWTKDVLNNVYPVPQALRIQLMCCLIAGKEAIDLTDASVRLQQAGI